jgi:predicted RNA binding protein YcfA (HicA-like mRNA interferase family)
LAKKEIYRNLKQSPNNIRFAEIYGITKIFGFKFKGGKGSHRIFVKEGIIEIINFQNVKGKVKPYQIKQFIKIIEKYGLLEE